MLLDLWLTLTDPQATVIVAAFGTITALISRREGR